jgi:hypothetical protein
VKEILIDGAITNKGNFLMSFALLTQAINEKKQVYANYAGYPRQFCPHVLGYTNDELRVLGYQFGGSSSKGSVYGEWKCFTVSNLSSLAVHKGQWHTDPSYSHSRSQQCITSVTARISF